MSPPTAPPRPGAGRPRRLSLPLVLDGAVRLIEQDGTQALSMRRLGRGLGVEAMALYRYVSNFDALLDAVVNRVVDEGARRFRAGSAAGASRPAATGPWNGPTTCPSPSSTSTATAPPGSAAKPTTSPRTPNS